MTKRQNASSLASANAKRPRKAAGFCFARPPSPSGSQPTRSSLFVTVTQNEHRPGILARGRVIASNLETVEPTTHSTIPVMNPQTQDYYNEITPDFDPDGPEVVASDTQEATKEPKRKRETTNYIHLFKICTDVLLNLYITRINSKNGYHSGTFSWMRFSVMMALVVILVTQNV